jgi:tRNA threonylcarbamoyladenosine biosynthesis protein TsaB
MILALRTNSPTAELYLYNVGEVARRIWRADRQLARDLLGEIDTLFGDKSWRDITGIVVFKGPGSFTGLRIGCTVMNTAAYARTIPIVGTSGDEWIADGLARLSQGENDHIILPDYGAEPRVTRPTR